MTRTEREYRLCRLIARQTLNKSDAAWLTKYITEGMDWSSVARTTFSEGLSSLLYYHCRNLNLLSHLPAEIRKQFGRIYAETSIINRHLLKTMDELAGALKKKNLNVIVFKGASLLNSVYHDPALRPMEDIDLMVHQENMKGLKSVLETMGFVQSKLYADSYSKGIISFDLHEDYLSSHRIASRRDIVDIKTADVWRMATPACGGAFFSSLSLDDTLIALSFHLLKHQYKGLIGFVDIAEIIKKHQSALSWSELVEHSRMVRAERILLYAFLLMKRLVGFNVPDHVLIDLGKDRLSFVEKTLLRLRLTHAEPGTLMYILWIFQIPGVGKKIRFVKENIFPRREVMNQILPASSPRVPVFLRRAIAAFLQVSSDGASAFRTAVKVGLPPL